MSGHGRRGRGGGHAGGGGHGGWLVTYADLLTLLMVVFLVLWVISQIDLAKFEKFKEGLGDFGNPAAQEAADAAAAAEAAAGAPTTTAPMILQGGDSLLTSTGELTSAGLEALATTVQEAAAMAGLPDIITVNETDRGLVITVSTDELLFESGSAAVAPDGAAVLAVIAPALGGFNNKVLVEGHTDKRPLRRAGYDNWDLSVDRAVAVVKLFRDQLGLDPLRLSAAGYGEMRPIAEGDDEASLAMNRRVEIVVLATQAPVATATDPAAADGSGVTEEAVTDPAADGTGVTEETVVAEPPVTEAEIVDDPLVPVGG